MNGPFSTFGLDSSPLLRKDLLEEIAQIITLPRPDHRDFHGLPEMGKSALLQFVTLPAFIETYRRFFLGEFKEHPDRLFFIYLSRWIKSVHPVVVFVREFYSNYHLYRDRMNEAHAEWNLPELSAPDSAGTPTDIDYRHQADEAADRMLEALEPDIRQLAECGVRPVFLFDEFDRDEAFGRFTDGQAARLSTWMAYCSFIFATERQLAAVNPAAKKGSPLFKRLTQTPIREFTPREARELLSNEFSEEQIDFLMKLTGGFPYLLLLAGRALWDIRRRMAAPPGAGQEKGGKANTAEPPFSESMRAVLKARLVAEFNSSFNVYYQAVDAEQREAMIELARNEQPQQEARRQLGAEMDPHDNRLSSLEQYGLIQIDDQGKIRLFSPLFRDFLLEQDRPAAAPRAMLELTGQQANLYQLFHDRPDQVLTYEELGRQVWDWPASPRSKPTEEDKRKIHIAVSKLRNQLDKAATGERIVSLRSKGYRFESPR